MFYYYCRPINWVFALFGIKKPFINSATGQPCKISAWNKLWSLILVAFGIIRAALMFSQKLPILSKMKHNLKQVFIINETLSFICIILGNLFYGEKVCSTLYVLVSSIVHDLKLSPRSIKLISMKIGLYIAVLSGINLTLFLHKLLSREVFGTNTLLIFTILVFRALIYIIIIHLLVHLALLLSILRVVNQLLSELLSFDHHRAHQRFLIHDTPSRFKTFKYIITPRLEFIEINRDICFDVKFLCKVYDDLGACIRLLEKHQGFQILQTLWILFSSSVITVTLLVCEELTDNEMAITMNVTIFCWCLLGCFLDDQLQKEVGCTDTLLVKCLIDFRCDQSRKNAVQIFKQVVCNNRLQFTACSLFRLNYSMMVGTIINIITYSIIFVQLHL